MIGLDAILDALRALRANILRSVLTTLGIIIGVGAVIIMVSIGSGAESRISSFIDLLGSNVMIVLPGSGFGRGAHMGRGTLPTLTEDDAIAIQKEIPGVQVAAPTVMGTTQVVFGNLNWSTAIYGVTPGFFEVREWEVAAGRSLEAQDVKASAKVTLLGETVARNLFPGENPLGQLVRINRVPFDVVGLLKAKGQTPMGHDQDDIVLIPLTTARQRVLGGRWLGGRTVGSGVFIEVG